MFLKYENHEITNDRFKLDWIEFSNIFFFFVCSEINVDTQFFSQYPYSKKNFQIECLIFSFSSIWTTNNKIDENWDFNLSFSIVTHIFFMFSIPLIIMVIANNLPKKQGKKTKEFALVSLAFCFLFFSIRFFCAMNESIEFFGNYFQVSFDHKWMKFQLKNFTIELFCCQIYWSLEEMKFSFPLQRYTC